MTDTMRMSLLKELWHRQRKLKTGQARDNGPHGKTREMILFSLQSRSRRRKAARTEPRDRSLRGKQRRLARKAHNKVITEQINSGQW